MNIHYKINKKSSETIPNGSTPEMGEKAALFKFYVLIDPIDGKIKYVGRTVDEGNRYRNHIYEAKKKNRNRRERWILYLIRRNLKPQMKVLYSVFCSLNEAISIEKSLIKCFIRRGFDLKNEADNYGGSILTGRMVYQYNLDGDIVSEYPNSNQAYISTGIKDSNILRCCKSENGYGAKTAGNYFWSFIRYEKYPHKYVNNWRELKGKEVYMYDLSMNLISCYETARLAAKATGLSYKKISSCANGRQKTIGRKYIFKFKQ